MIQEEYVSFETAKMLEEIGFDEPCDWAYYNDGKIAAINAINSTLSRGYISRPTQSLAARWIREVHRIVVDVFFIPPSAKEDEWKYFICKMDDLVLAGDFVSSKFTYKTYEQAMEAGILFSLKLIINKQKKNK